jgi:hypothetical protein
MKKHNSNLGTRSYSLGNQDPTVSLSIQSNSNYAENSFLKTQNLKKFGAKPIKLN